MARYRSKDSTDLSWNKIRRHLTRELDTAIQDRREEALNDLLTKAWDDYTRALGEGKVPEVETKYATLSLAIVEEIIPDAAQILEGADAPVE